MMIGYIYSLDDNITISDLKNGKYSTEYDFESIKKRFTANHVGMMIDGENSYHFKFSQIVSKPYIIYYMGNVELLNKYLIGMVGPRAISEYGKNVLDDFFKNLKNHDVCTVSGLAEGVDSMAHELSIKNNIPTIAVLGGGLRRFLKSRNRDLIQKIIDNGGLVLSEFKIDKMPEKYTFPQRNRIIAGLSDFVFVPEAGENSGSLITVDFALKMNKEVFGVPNSIYSTNSIGINKYIGERKIYAISNLEQFINSKIGFLKLSTKKAKTDVPVNMELSLDEKNIISIISEIGLINISDLIEKSGKNLSDLMVILSILESKGLICEKSIGEYGLVLN